MLARIPIMAITTNNSIRVKALLFVLSCFIKLNRGKRADFVKVDFVFRKNWSGETKTLTTFIVGIYHTFESGITTDATLLPGAVGTFELYVPHSFGSFIGYSYVIDWMEYE